MSNYLAGIFGSSPVAPLQEHMDKCYRCAKELIPFFEAVTRKDWDSVQQSRHKISELENEADDLKQEIRGHLPKSLFMPVPREDLLELLLVQDRIANRTRDVSGLIVGRNSIPTANGEMPGIPVSGPPRRSPTHNRPGNEVLLWQLHIWRR